MSPSNISTSLAHANYLLQQATAHLNAEQRQAVFAPLAQPLQVLAGPGTGKTELIAWRAVVLAVTLQETQQLDTLAEALSGLMLVTFTEKAAREMRQRVARYANQLAVAMGQKGTITPELLTPESLITVNTFHGLSAMLLENRRQLMDTVQRQQLFTQLWHEHPHWAEILVDTLGYAVNLDRWQQALPEMLGRIKTMGLTPQQFVQQATHAGQVFVQTVAQLPYALGPGYCCTMAERIAAWQTQLLPYTQLGPTAWQPFSDDDTEATLKKQVDFLTGWLFEPTQSKLPLGTETCKTYAPVSAQQQADNQAWLSHYQAANTALIHWIAELYQAYQQRCAQHELGDYEDLLLDVLALPPQYERFQAVIVDEFQDSNPSQCAWLQQFISKKRPALTVVGDAKQAIYGFRDARPENMNAIFEALRCEPQQIALTQNYRSNAPIVALSNAVSAFMQVDAGQALQAVQETSQTPQSAVTVWFPEPEAETQKLTITQAHAQETQRLIAWAQALALAPGQNSAILVRNHQRAAALVQAMNEAGLSVSRMPGRGFFETPESQIAWALFTLCCVQSSIERKLAEACLLQYAYGDAALSKEKIEEFDTIFAMPAVPCLDVLLETWQRYVACYQQAQPVQPLPEPVFVLWQRWLESKIQGFTAKTQALFGDVSGNVSTNSVHQLWQLCQLYRQNDAFELTDAVATDDLVQSGLQVLTMHQAKGLEFSAVAVAGVDTWLLLHQEDTLYGFDADFGWMLGGYQGRRSPALAWYQTLWQKPRQLAEQHRLWYVALTRAKQQLLITLPSSALTRCPAWLTESLSLHETNC